MVKTELKNLFSSWAFHPKRHQRTFIFPTRFGIYFSFSMFFLLAIAFIYSNNVVYFICFFLIALGFVSMWFTNKNVEQIKMSVSASNDFFADEQGRINVFLENKGNSSAYLLRLKIRHSNHFQSVFEIPPRQSQTIQLPISIKTRGSHQLPALVLESHFPFGWFRSWKYHYSHQQVLVYPSREGKRRLPEAFHSEGYESGGQKKLNSGDNVFLGHRPYQNFDSLRRVDWKAFARTQELLVKQFESESQGQLQLRWEDTSGSTEKKLSQLSLWISECEKAHRPYQLVLPGEKTDWGLGPKHSRECLKKLSLFEGPRES